MVAFGLVYRKMEPEKPPPKPEPLPRVWFDVVMAEVVFMVPQELHKEAQKMTPKWFRYIATEILPRALGEIPPKLATFLCTTLSQRLAFASPDGEGAERVYFLRIYGDKKN